MTELQHLLTTHAIRLLAQDAPAAEAATSGKTLLDYINDGGLIGYIILALSFVAVALIIAHLVQVRLAKLAPPEIVTRMHELLRSGDVSGAVRYAQAEENDSFFARVVGGALARCARSPFGFLELKAALEEEGTEQVARLQRSTDGIGLIASVAPMLGLLGTVVGMVGAFETISQTDGFAKPGQLAGDISLALITTVQGLVVAIPCTALYAWTRSRIERITGEVAELVEELASHVEAAPAQAASGHAPRPAPRPVSMNTAAQVAPTTPRPMGGGAAPGGVAPA
jgi:biopolymer transport protein ExbB